MGKTGDISVQMADKMGDLWEFRRVMGLLAQVVRPGLAVQQGGAYIATALRAATKISPQKRRVRKMSVKHPAQTQLSAASPGASLKWKTDEEYKNAVAANAESGRFLYEVNIRNKWNPLWGFYASRSDAIKQPIVEIENRGLANMLWWKMSAILLNGQGVKGTAESFRYKKNVSTEGSAMRNIRLQLQDNRVEAKLAMGNSLKYAFLAFKTSGRATLGNTMRRASNNMRKFIERETKTKIREHYK